MAILVFANVQKFLKSLKFSFLWKKVIETYLSEYFGNLV